MIESRLRALVLRLMSEDFRPDDLSTLFLAVRERSDGREAVREIGDSVAHAAERNRGPVTRVTRDFFTSAKFQVFQSEPGNKPIDLANLPSDFKEILWASFRCLKSEQLKEGTGLTRVAAERLLEKVSKSVAKGAKGETTLIAPLTSKELMLLEWLAGSFAYCQAFDADDLFAGFQNTLRSNRLLRKEEEGAFKSLRDPILLFALTKLHRSYIDLGDGTKGYLGIASDRDSKLSIAASVPIFVPRLKEEVTMSGFFFLTGLTPKEHCDEALMAKITTNDSPMWGFDVELGPNKLLTILK